MPQKTNEKPKAKSKPKTDAAPETTPAAPKNNLLPFAILAIIVIIVTCAKVSPQTPEESAKLFCRAGNHPVLATRLFTPELRTAWQDAETKNTAWAQKHPGEKPPFGDGIPLAGYPDAGSKCEPGKATATTVEIHHNFPDQPKGNWTDRLVLKHTDTGYWIDDIQFSHHGTLRHELKSAF